MMTRSISMRIRNAERPERGVRLLAGRLVGALAICSLALAGCDDFQTATTFEPVRDGSNLYGALTLDHRAVNLSTVAPYDTIRLTATPRNLRGEPMTGMPAPTFRSSDTMSVWVTQEGLVQARRATAGVQIIAELATGDNIRHADTTIVKVTEIASPPELASLEITFASPEDALWPMTTGEFGVLGGVYFTLAGLPVPGSRVISTSARDGMGNPINGLEIDFVSLSPTVFVNRRNGAVENVIGPPGEEATIVARTTAYGITRADTATITVAGPMVNTFLISEAEGQRGWMNSEVVVRPGGVVTWYYVSLDGTPFDVIFEDTTNIEPVPELCAVLGAFMPHFCGAGNISISGVTEAHLRRFPQPGIYEFTAPKIGWQGRVRVVADDDPFWDNARN